MISLSILWDTTFPENGAVSAGNGKALKARKPRADNVVQGGITGGLDQTLRPGTYYLTETKALGWHRRPDPAENTVFTITEKGQVIILAGEGYVENNGSSCSVRIPNEGIPQIIPAGASAVPQTVMSIAAAAVFILAALLFKRKKKYRNRKKLQRRC